MRKATIEDIIGVVTRSLGLSTEAFTLSADTELLGKMPEFDSQSVVTILLNLEETFDITISDDEVSADMFINISSLHTFVEDKLASA